MKPETLFWFLPAVAALIMVLWAGIGWGLNKGYDEGASVAAGEPQTQASPLTKRLVAPVLLLMLLSIALGGCLAASLFRECPADLAWFFCGGGCCLAIVAVIEAIKRTVEA